MADVRKKINWWIWIRAILALVLSSTPSWLTYLNIQPSTFNKPFQWIYENFFLTSIPIPLPVLLGILIFIFPFIPKWFNSKKFITNRNFEREYVSDKIKFIIYTSYGKSALKYQDEVHYKAVCPIHLNKLDTTSSRFGVSVHVCALCKNVISEDVFQKALREAKSKFLLELAKK